MQFLEMGRRPFLVSSSKYTVSEECCGHYESALTAKRHFSHLVESYIELTA
jgi:hypothetical protein